MPDQGPRIAKPEQQLAEVNEGSDTSDRGHVARVGMLGTLFVLFVASLGWLVFDLVVNPITAANFLPYLLPTLWPLPALVATPIVGGMVCGVLLTVPRLRAIANRISSAALLAAVVALYLLAWPLIFTLNLGQA